MRAITIGNLAAVVLLAASFAAAAQDGVIFGRGAGGPFIIKEAPLAGMDLPFNETIEKIMSEALK